MRNRNVIGLTTVLFLIGSSTVFAQAVQLPTFTIFNVNTTVSIPDRGSAYLGGVDRARIGSVTRGVPILNKIPIASRLFKNRGIGTETNVTSLRAHATIIDIHEMDEAILAEARARGSVRGSRESAIVGKADFLSSHLARNTATWDSRTPVSTRLKPRKVSSEQAILAQRSTEAEAFLTKGQQAEAAGKRSVAKIYYDMALRRAEGELKEQIQIRLAGLFGGRDAIKVASRD